MKYDLEGYIELTYEKLGLSHDGHEIGTTRFIELPAEVFYTICIRRLNFVRQQLFERRDEHGWEELVRTMGFLPFKEWQHNVKKIQRYDWGNVKAPDHHERRDAIIGREFYRLYQRHRYEASFAGWQQYVCDASPFFREEVLLKEFPVRIPESTRQEHTYLCGQTGSGKTELAKLLIHSYIVHHPETALVIIEPTGKLSTEVAQLRENYGSNRLIYVTYDRDHGLAPHINPLRISGLSPSDTSRRALDLKDTFADELVEALGEMIKAEGETFTVHMETALRRCLHVLLDKEGATLRDLVNFMNDGENEQLVAFALSRIHDPDGVSYFTTKFKAKDTQLTQTKNSLYSRLSSLVIGRALGAITCADNTIDLEEEINAKKIIIFELSGRFGPRQGPAFGRLVLAMIRAMALRRDELIRKKVPLVPVHVFIDECHNYVSASIKKIMREARKYQVMLTLTETEVGAEMPPATRDAVIGGTKLKIGGRAGEPQQVARLLRVNDDDIASLDKTEFILRSGDLPYPISFKAHGHLADDRHSMSEAQWQKVWKRQTNAYYRPIERSRSVPESSQPTKVQQPRKAGTPAKDDRPPPARRPTRVTEDENII